MAWRILRVPLLAGAILRIAAVFLLAPHVPILGDSNEYLNLGRNFLAHGSLFVARSADVRPPLFSMLVALGLVPSAGPPSLASPQPWVYLLQIAFDLGTILVSATIAQRRFGTGAARATAWFAALMPASIVYASALVMAESVVGFFVVLALLLLDRSDDPPRPARAFGIGVVLAVAIQVKEMGALFAAAAVVVTLTRRVGALRARSVAAGAILVGLALGMAPWTIVTARVTGRPLPTGTYGHLALMYDNAPQGVLGHDLWNAQKSLDKRIAAAHRTFVAAFTEYPRLTLQRAWIRLRVLFGPETYLPAVAIACPFEGFVPEIHSLPAFYRSTWRLPEGTWGRRLQFLFSASIWFLFTAAAAGVALAGGTRIAAVFGWLVALFVVVALLTVSMDRYRQGLVPVALPLAGCALARFANRRAQPWPRGAVVAAAVTGVVLFVTMFALGPPS